MAKDDDKAPVPEKRSKLGLILGIALGLVVLVAATVAGVLLGPRLLGTAPVHAGETRVKQKIVPVRFEPIIIDIRGRRGEVHHLKVGLAAELRQGTTEDEFKLVQPRGREAALSYLRTLSISDVSDPDKYLLIKDELSKSVTNAVGPERIERVLLIDFVAQ